MIARLILLILLAAPAAAAAQERATVFVHGFNASGADWAPTAERLRQMAAIEPHLPSLGWRQRYDEQAVELHNALGWLPGSTAVVAHSNGGVVAREWSRIRPLGGLATIGTPHRGVPLVAAFHRWVGFHSQTPDLLNQVLGAFSIDTDVTWVWTLVEEAVSWASDFSLWSVFDVARVIGLEAGLPVLGQARPYSEYFGDLNSAGNLAREAGAIPHRVGIVSIAHNFFWAGPARAAVPDRADEIASALYGAAGALLFWSTYIQTTSGWHDVYRFQQAMSLLDVAQHLLSVDPFYCSVVSRWNLTACLPNDGVIPDESQFFPLAANIIIHGPAHTQEKERSDEVLRDALVYFLHVPERDNPAPPSSGGSDAGGPSAGAAGTLVGGQTLYPGDSVRSPNGLYTLFFQHDGNLVLYDQHWHPRWDSRTPGTEPGSLAMQGDGNLVIYDPWGHPLWSTGTHTHPGAYLAVQDNGEAVIYSASGEVRWRTGTGS